MSTPARKWTKLLQSAIRDGVLSHEAVTEMCLEYMSELDVELMCQQNDLKEFLDPTDDDERMRGQEDNWQAEEAFFLALGNGTASQDN